MEREGREDYIRSAIELIGSFKDQICNIGLYEEYQHEYIADKKYKHS